MKASLLHIDEKWRNYENQRPLLSAAVNFEQCVQFRLREENVCSESNGVKPLPPGIARIDLWALVLDGVIKEHNFVRLDTAENFEKYFLHSPHKGPLLQYAADNKIVLGSCMSTSIHLGEVLIGARGKWWVPYSFLIDDGDRLLATQIGGYNNTVFGQRLLDIYTSIPHHPKHQVPQQAQSQPANLKPRPPSAPPPSWLK